MDTLFTLHSHMRHLVFLMMAVTLVITVSDYIRYRRIGKLADAFVRIYSIILDVQALAGIIVLVVFWGDGTPMRHRFEHALIMILAITVLHLRSRWKKAAPEVIARATVICLAASIILILTGIFLLPQFATLLYMK